MTTEANRSKGTSILYWITTVFTAFTMISGGLWLMTNTEAMDAHLGYPAYFWLILGFWKLAGGIAIVIPRFPLLKEWAYAGIFFNMTGAAASRIFVHDSAGHIIAPIVICAIAVASWYLRPVSRKADALTLAEGSSQN